MTKRARFIASLFLVVILVSCATSTPESLAPSTSTDLPQPSATIIITSTPRAAGLYKAPGIPDSLAAEAETWGIPFVTDPGRASMRLELASAGDESTIASKSNWIYVLVAPFPYGHRRGQI